MAERAGLYAQVGLLAATRGDDTGGDTASPETTNVTATTAVPTTADDAALPDGPEGPGVAVTDTIPVGDFPIGVAVSDEAVWVANFVGGKGSRIG